MLILYLLNPVFGLFAFYRKQTNTNSGLAMGRQYTNSCIAVERCTLVVGYRLIYTIRLNFHLSSDVDFHTWCDIHYTTICDKHC
jgi:hypothetical protein